MVPPSKIKTASFEVSSINRKSMDENVPALSNENSMLSTNVLLALLSKRADSSPVTVPSIPKLEALVPLNSIPVLVAPSNASAVRVRPLMVEVPEVDTPELPKVDTPQVPEIDTPDMPEVDTPEVPDVEKPDAPNTDM